jgi:hypothetical protein
VAHNCNPSYSGGRDQKDHSLKPAWENSLRPHLEKTLHKNRAGGAAQGEGLKFKPQYSKRKKETNNKYKGFVQLLLHLFLDLIYFCCSFKLYKVAFKNFINVWHKVYKS